MAQVLVICGVCGSGKSTIGAALAAAANCTFADADDYHPHSNLEKMAAGAPLTDDDRGPWLARLRALIQSHLKRSAPLVLACSALKAKYRRQLAGRCDGGGAAAAATSSASAGVAFVLLDPPRQVLETRLAARAGSHFMPPSLLASQLDALEVGGEDNGGDDDIGWLLVVGSGNNNGGCDGAGGGCHGGHSHGGVRRRLCAADDWPPGRIASEIVRAWTG